MAVDFGGYDKAASIWMRPFLRLSLVVWLISIPLTPALSPKGARGKGADWGMFKTCVQLETVRSA
ncbi:hypothetical protein PspR84_16965 [Pseudomonas sp. R84]|nr:hypothetical protein PspR84_16965 [Pseudomonas sp. R84]